MTLKELAEKYGYDFEINISLYSCGNTFELPLKECKVVKVDAVKKIIVFDAERN